MPDRLFIKVHHNFPEHWKTVELSDRAFRQLIEAWCFCARTLTDGRLTDAQSRKLFTPKTIGELTKVGFMRKADTGYEMHDYLEHQQSAADVADLHEKRREAGRRGGKAKAQNLASASPVAKQTPSKDVPEVEIDLELEITTTNPPTVGSPAKKSKPKSRLPEEYTPSDAAKEWVREHCPGITASSVDLSTRRFLDHYANGKGSRETRADWHNTWRNWVETDWTRSPTVRTASSGFGAGRSTTDDRVAGTLALAARYADAESRPTRLGIAQ